jgi:hypothetical protein
MEGRDSYLDSRLECGGAYGEIMDNGGFLMRVFECEKCHRFKQDVAKCTVYEIGYMKSKKVHYLCNDCKNAAIDKGHLVLKPI